MLVHFSNDFNWFSFSQYGNLYKSVVFYIKWTIFMGISLSDYVRINFKSTIWFSESKHFVSSERCRQYKEKYHIRLFDFHSHGLILAVFHSNHIKDVSFNIFCYSLNENETAFKNQVYEMYTVCKLKYHNHLQFRRLWDHFPLEKQFNYLFFFSTISSLCNIINVWTVIEMKIQQIRIFLVQVHPKIKTSKSEF